MTLRFKNYDMLNQLQIETGISITGIVIKVTATKTTNLVYVMSVNQNHMMASMLLND